MADYYTLLTNAGIAYETACKAAGVPIKLSQISVGDGAGAVYNPAATATALKREVWRGPLNALFQDEKNPSWLLAEVTIPPEEGGWYVREAGLWTDTGILYAIVKYPESFKPVLATSGSGKEFYIRSIFETSNASSVTLLIDDTVVKATRAWVMAYLADELARLDGKQSVRVATTANIVLSGAQEIDGVAVVSGQRVLVAAQTAAKDNGIYVVANGAWVRSVDADTSAKVTPGLMVMVEEGTANGDSLWHLVTNGPITLGTTALSFEMLAGRTGIQAGTYKSVTVDKYGRATGGTNPETLAGFGIKDTYTKPEIDSLIAQASALPVGTMVAFPVSKIAPGFLEIDGSVKSIATYPDLAAFLGTAFNKGDEGAGNFRLPESRGEFLRGWDHGRGVDVGRAVGSWQADEFKKHRHPQYEYDTGVPTPIPDDSRAVDLNASYTVGLERTALIAYAGGSETRPRNLAVLWCIKAWNAPINQGNIDIAALAASIAVATPKYYMAGFGMALNAAAPTTTIDVAPGHARVTGNPVTLNASLSGVLQAAGAWAAGSGVNKLDAGVRAANTWYHVFIIRKLVGGDGDLLFSTSVAAPVVPAGFEVIQRIGSIKTDAAATIIPFINVGRSFFWSAPIKDASGSISANGNSTTGITVSVPPGVRVLARFHAAFTGIATNLYFRAPDAASISSAWLFNNSAATLLAWNGGLGMNTSDIDLGSFPFETLTNPVAAIVMQWQNAGTAGFYAIVTLGWTEL